MAMTKRLHVAFDVGVVFSTEDVEEFTKHVIKNSKKFMNGEKLRGFDLEVARVAAEHGIESAVELVMKSHLAKALREEFLAGGSTCSNVSIKVVQ